jgi:hypothetical protein
MLGCVGHRRARARARGGKGWRPASLRGLREKERKKKNGPGRGKEGGEV